MIEPNLNKKIHLLVLVFIVVSLNMPMIFNNIAIILYVVFLVINFKKTKGSGTKVLYLLPAIIYALDILSYFNSYNGERALFDLEKRVSLVLFALGFFLLPKVSNIKLQKILSFFVISLTIVCLIGISIAFYKNYQHYGLNINYQTYWLIGHHKYSEPIGFHATYLSNYIIFALGVLLFKKNSSILDNVYLKGFVSIIFLISFMIMSVRTSFISIIFLSIFYIFSKYKSKRDRVLFFIVALIGFSLFLYNNTILKERFEDVFSIGKSKNESRFGGMTLRKLKWQSAYHIFEENLVFGVGNGDIQNKLNNEYRKINDSQYELIGFNSHNQYLNELASKGIIGFLALIAFILISLRYAYKNKNKLLVILLGINCISFITENILTRNKGIIFLFFFYCLLCSNLDFNIEKNKNEGLTNT